METNLSNPLDFRNLHRETPPAPINGASTGGEKASGCRNSPRREFIVSAINSNNPSTTGLTSQPGPSGSAPRNDRYLESSSDDKEFYQVHELITMIPLILSKHPPTRVASDIRDLYTDKYTINADTVRYGMWTTHTPSQNVTFFTKNKKSWMDMLHALYLVHYETSTNLRYLTPEIFFGDKHIKRLCAETAPPSKRVSQSEQEKGEIYDIIQHTLVELRTTYQIPTDVYKFIRTTFDFIEDHIQEL